MFPAKPVPKPDMVAITHYEQRVMELFGFAPDNIAVMFLHNLQSIERLKGKKFSMPIPGRKHPQPCGLVRREVKHFLVLYPAARHWQRPDWAMFLHFNPVHPHPVGSVEYISSLLNRAVLARAPVGGTRKRYIRPTNNPPQEAIP